MRQKHQQCHFVDLDGNRCPAASEQRGLCFWHDRKAAKTDPDIKARLEALIKDGRSGAGFELKGADLRGAKLVCPGSRSGVNLSGADFYHANLSGAHLFQANMQRCSLMKADLSQANLNCANLEHANLLGTEFEKTKIENVQWGEHVVQERKGRQALKAGDHSTAMDLFQQSEEVYRNLRKVAEYRGLFEHAGTFFHHEMTMRRFRMPRFSISRFISKMVDLFCGYGEKPINVIVFSLLLIFVCATIYFFMGIMGSEGEIIFQSTQSLVKGLTNFLYCIYFSVVTFTTLGYGDISPIGWTRMIASIEAFMGSFILALFVVVFVKKMTR